MTVPPKPPERNLELKCAEVFTTVIFGVHYMYIVLLLDFRGIRMETSAATRINFRTDLKTKRSAEKLFDALGLDMTTALNMFLKQAVRDQALPIRPALT